MTDAFLTEFELLSATFLNDLQVMCQNPNIGENFMKAATSQLSVLTSILPTAPHRDLATGTGNLLSAQATRTKRAL